MGNTPQDSPGPIAMNLSRASCIAAFSQSHDDESPRQRTLSRVGLLTTRVNYIHIYVYTCTHEYVFIFHRSHIHMYMYIHGDLGPGVHASFSLKAGRGLPLFSSKEKGPRLYPDQPDRRTALAQNFHSAVWFRKIAFPLVRLIQSVQFLAAGGQHPTR